MPIWNWNLILKTGDLRYLLKSITTPVDNFEELNKIYESFYNAYLKEFELNDKAQSIIDIKVRYIENLALYLQGDKSVETFIDIDKLELDELNSNKSENQNQSIWDLKARMEVALKISIDVKKCSVIEFYTYLKIISEMNTKE